MSSRDEVERALRADAAHVEPPHVTIDTRAVARGARARRMPLQVAVGAASVLAVVGFGGVAIASLPNLGGQASSSDAEAEAPEIGPLASPGGDSRGDEDFVSEDGETAWSLFACGAPLPPVGHGADFGLDLDILPLDAAGAESERLPVTVTLTNSTDALITGSSAIWPHLALASGETVVWHTAGGMDGVAVAINLGPGQSLRYETHLDLLVCEGPAGDEPFPRDLPAAPAGEYEVVAALDVSAPGTAGGVIGTELVISPRASLTVP